MYVFLTGAPGSGKSAVAPHVAELLGARVIELDDAIARRAGRTIAEIFERDGERPLLVGGDRRARLDALLRERSGAYADADVHVRTDAHDPQAIARAIVAAIVA